MLSWRRRGARCAVLAARGDPDLFAPLPVRLGVTPATLRESVRELGLRSLFFLLAGIMGLFRFLKVGISVILCFVGAKMTLADLVHVPIGASLSIVVGVLALSILFSVFVPQRAKA